MHTRTCCGFSCGGFAPVFALTYVYEMGWSKETRVAFRRCDPKGFGALANASALWRDPLFLHQPAEATVKLESLRNAT